MSNRNYKPDRNGHNLFDDDEESGFFRFGRLHDVFELPQKNFITLANALIVNPVPQFAVGRNGVDSSQSGLFWAYSPNFGLHVEAKAGFMSTKTGNGGFSLDVKADGSWELHFVGSKKEIGHDADEDGDRPRIPKPPVGNTQLTPTGSGAVGSVDASAGHITVNSFSGWDTIQGGVGDYLIGGGGTLGGGQAGAGNCAIYTKSQTGAILVDMEQGRGYGGNAEDNILININQVRGTAAYTNVLIGSSKGSDLKSGGDNSLLISTGGNGFELRPDGSGNVLVSTAGEDWVAFDPNKAWQLGDNNIVLGFDAESYGLAADDSVGGDFIDLRLLTTGKTYFFKDSTNTWSSDFHNNAAADITDYVKIADQADGSHVMFDPDGKGAAYGATEILTLKFVHGLDVTTLHNQGSIVL